MKNKISTHDLVLVALLAAILIAVKEVIAFLPNIELVSLFVILYTLHFQRLTPYIIYVFVAVECCFYGLQTWVIMYMYVWILLHLLVRLLRRYSSHLLWIIVSTGFGFLYGLICSPVYLFIGGWSMAFAWFVSGIPFDIMHGLGNLAACTVLYLPLDRVFTRLKTEKIIKA